jgi:hypothetical protein
VVGDILLDVVVRLDGLIQPDTDTYGHAVVGAGGQAANVAAWIVALGGSAALVGRHLIRQELHCHGVILHSPPAAPSTKPSSGPGSEGRTGTVVSVATPDGRRTMLQQVVEQHHHQRQGEHGLHNQADARAGLGGGWPLVVHHITFIPTGPSDRSTPGRLIVLLRGRAAAAHWSAG